jgi:hypothetical protein
VRREVGDAIDRALEALPPRISIERLMKHHPEFKHALKFFYEDPTVPINQIPDKLSQLFRCTVTAGNVNERSDSIAARISLLARGYGFTRNRNRSLFDFIPSVLLNRELHLEAKAPSAAEPFSISDLTRILGMPRTSVRRMIEWLGLNALPTRHEQARKLLDVSKAFLLGTEAAARGVALLKPNRTKSPLRRRHRPQGRKQTKEPR